MCALNIIYTLICTYIKWSPKQTITTVTSDTLLNVDKWSIRKGIWIGKQREEEDCKLWTSLTGERCLSEKICNYTTKKKEL